MPQDFPATGPQLSATPYEQTDAFQNLLRTPPVAFDKGHGISQWFRGTVGTNSTLVLNTNNVALNSYTMGLLAGGRSRLTISANRNPSGTGMDLSHNEKVGAPKPGQGNAMKAIGKVMKLNRIKSIITAPIDQLLQIEILFGTHHGANSWKGSYSSGQTIVVDSAGIASMASIRLTCNNPVNPGWFSFYASIAILPQEQPAPVTPSSSTANPLSELKHGFARMIRNMETGRNPW